MIITDKYIQADGYFFQDSVEFWGEIFIGRKTIIEKNCFIGKPHRDVLRNIITGNSEKGTFKKTYIGKECYIEEGTIISFGATIGNNVVCSEYTTIGEDSIIKDNTKIHYKAQIFKRVEIGTDSKIGGFICNDSIIGNNCSIYGSLIHKYRRHGGEDLDNKHSGSPKIGNNVVVGFNSSVIGGVTIGDNVYISAGAIVTKNIPSNSIVKSINKISKWNYLDI